MRLKYYLRGAGIALIIAGIIWMISSAFISNDIPKSTIESEAAKLGMSYPENRKLSDVNDDDDKQTEDTAAAQNDSDAGDAENADMVNAGQGNPDTADNQGEESPEELVEFNISAGESSSVISSHLQEQGLVSDSEAFDDYITSQNADNFLRPGVHIIRRGATFEEIANILTGR